MIKIRSLWILLGCLLLLSGCGEARRSYELGVSQYKNGEYSLAEASFRLALSQGETDPVLLADLALACAKLGEREEAEAQMEAALEKAADNSQVLKRVGLAKAALGDDAEALSYLNRSLTTPAGKMSENDLETCGFAAAIEAENGCFEEAIRLYDLLISQGYYSMEHQLLAGLSYLGLHQTEAAEQYFELAAKHEEVPAEWFLKIYQGYLAEGESLRAEKWFEAGLSHIREDSGLTAAAYYAYAGKTQEAMELFEEETTAAGLLAYARSLTEAGRYTEAEAAVSEVIGLGEELPWAYFEYFRLKVLTAEKDEALRLLSQARSYGAEAPEEALDWNEIMLYERTGDYETAFERLSSYMKQYGADTEVLREYAFLSRVALSE